MTDSIFGKALPGPGNSVIYEGADGKKYKYSGGDRAWRNNNPGNLVPGIVSKRNGVIGKAGGFAVFPSYESGHAALLDSLKSMHGNKNLKEMIGVYAPKHENKTEQYLNFLKKETGVKDDRKIKDFTPQEFENLWRAIEKMEGAKTGKIEEISSPSTKNKKQIDGVMKNKKKTIVAYHVVGMGWVSKSQAIKLAKTGKIDAVVATSRSGNLFLRTRPDVFVENNLENMG